MLIAFMCLQAMAQYGTDKVRISFPVRYMPAFYVPEGNHYYHVNYDAARLVKEYIDYGEVCDRLQIGGDWQEETSNETVPVYLNVVAQDFMIERFSEMERVEKVRHHGEEFLEKYFVPVIDYSMVLETSLNINGQTTCFTTNINSETRRPNISSFVVEDKRFRSPHDCHIFLKENKELFVEKIVRAEVMGLTDIIQGNLNNALRYYPTTDDIKICILDSKKSEYYAKHLQAKAEISRIISNMPLEGPLTQTIKDMQPWINHFKELEASLSMTDKKQKNAKADMVYTLAMIYYALEIFDVSRDYCSRLLNEFGENSGKRMLRNLTDVEDQMKKHHLSSRHF